MANQRGERTRAEGLCADPKELATFQADLLQVIHVQAKEMERLTTQVEQHTKRLLAPSEMPLVISELSELHPRLQRNAGHVRQLVDGRALLPELRGQRIPIKDMDELC